MGYKYILNRWVKIVFDLFLRRTPGSTVPRAYGYRRTWDIYAICVRRTAAQLHALYITTISVCILYYITTISTDTDRVRIEIPVPLDVVLELYVVSTFTVVFTIGLPTHYLLTTACISTSASLSLI